MSGASSLGSSGKYAYTDGKVTDNLCTDYVEDHHRSSRGCRSGDDGICVVSVKLSLL